MAEQRWNPVCERPPDWPSRSIWTRPVRTDPPACRVGRLDGSGWRRDGTPGPTGPTASSSGSWMPLADSRNGDAVTAWAALRWRGGAFFDGLEAGGRERLPVPLIARCSLASLPGLTLSKAQLAPTEWQYVAGLPVTTVQRALFDEVVRRNELWASVEAVCMAAAARLISTRLFALHLLHRSAWTGVPLARKAAGAGARRLSVATGGPAAPHLGAGRGVAEGAVQPPGLRPRRQPDRRP